MKRIVLIGIFSVMAFSCSKNAEQIEIVKKDVERNLSEIEKKDVVYTSFEISDRDAYEEIAKYDLKRLNKAQENLDDLFKQLKLGKYRVVSFDDMSNAELMNYEKNYEFSKSFSDRVKTYMSRYSNDLKELGKLKGDKIYYKVEVIKLNPDTLLHRKVYLDNKNIIITSNAIK